MIYKVKMLVSEHGLEETEITSYYASKLCEKDLRKWLFGRYKGYHTFIIKDIKIIFITNFLMDNNAKVIELEV